MVRRSSTVVGPRYATHINIWHVVRIFRPYLITAARDGITALACSTRFAPGIRGRVPCGCAYRCLRAFRARRSYRRAGADIIVIETDASVTQYQRRSYETQKKHDTNERKRSTAATHHTSRWLDTSSVQVCEVSPSSADSTIGISTCAFNGVLPRSSPSHIYQLHTTTAIDFPRFEPDARVCPGQHGGYRRLRAAAAFVRARAAELTDCHTHDTHVSEPENDWLG